MGVNVDGVKEDLYTLWARDVFFLHFMEHTLGERGSKWVKMKNIQLFLDLLKILDVNLN
jgi:hypothetical protein